MIKFPCRCGNEIEVPDDQAGGMVQCPKCGLLRDVPTLSDMGHLEADGTYEMGARVEETEEQRLEKLRRAFMRGRTDDEGDEIDLRPTMEDVMAAGTEEIPLKDQDDLPPAMPKYDPVTGDLIEPLKVKETGQPSASEIPMAKRAVTYASADTREVSTVGRVLVQMFEPANLAVMFFVILLHALLGLTFLVASVIYVFFFVLAPFMIAVMAAIMGHYANVIEDTGPEQHDELPRPMRHMDIRADIWWPFIAMAGSMMICYYPALWVMARVREEMPELAVPAGLLVAILGAAFFPAILLTLATSGTSWNLRPDRVWSVVRSCGLGYWVAVGTFPVAGFCYLVGLIGTYGKFLLMLAPRGTRAPWITHPALAWPTLLVGVYLTHAACWYLGLLYRKHHAQFDWVLQRHIPTKLMERTKRPPGAGPKRPAPPKRTPEQERRLQELREEERAKRARGTAPAQQDPFPLDEIQRPRGFDVR